MRGVTTVGGHFADLPLIILKLILRRTDFYVSKDDRQVSESLVYSDTPDQLKKHIDKTKKKAKKIISIEQIGEGKGEKIFLLQTGFNNDEVYSFFTYIKNSTSLISFSAGDLRALKDFDNWRILNKR